MSAASLTGRDQNLADRSVLPVRHIATHAEVIQLVAGHLGYDPGIKGMPGKRLENVAQFYSVFRRWAMAAGGQLCGHTRWIDVDRRLHERVDTLDDLRNHFRTLNRFRRDLEAVGLLRIRDVPAERGRARHIFWELLPVPSLDSPPRRDSSVGREPGCHAWRVRRRSESRQERSERRIRPHNRRLSGGCRGLRVLPPDASHFFWAGANSQSLRVYPLSPPLGGSGDPPDESLGARAWGSVDAIGPPSRREARAALDLMAAADAAAGGDGRGAAGVAWRLLLEVAADPMAVLEAAFELRYGRRPIPAGHRWWRQGRRYLAILDAAAGQPPGTEAAHLAVLVLRYGTEPWHDTQEPRSLAFFLKPIQQRARDQIRRRRFLAGRRDSPRPKPWRPDPRKARRRRGPGGDP